MPQRSSSPFYNNPQMGQAFQNIATAITGDPAARGQAALRRAQIEQAAATTGKTRAETDALQVKAQATSGISDLFGGRVDALNALNVDNSAATIDTGDDLARAAAEEQRMGAASQFMTDLPARLMQLGVPLAGDPGQLADLYRMGVANDTRFGDNAVVRAMAGAGNALGENEAVSVSGQDRVRRANSVNALRLQEQKDAASLFRQNRLPVQTAPGGITTFAPGDPRNGGKPVYGRDTFSTARGAAITDLFRNGPDGYSPEALAAMGATPNGDAVKNDILERAANGEEVSNEERIYAGLMNQQPFPTGADDVDPGDFGKGSEEIDGEINAQLGRQFDSDGNLVAGADASPEVMTALRIRIAELFGTGVPAAEATQQAIQELVDVDPGQEAGFFARLAPGQDQIDPSVTLRPQTETPKPEASVSVSDAFAPQANQFEMMDGSTRPVMREGVPTSDVLGGDGSVKATATLSKQAVPQDGLPAVPAPLANMSNQLQWSPSLQMWRNKATGEIFSADGRPAT